MDQLVVKAQTRKESGKGAAKRIRASGRLPAVMYNSKGEAVMLDVDAAEFTKVWKLATPTTLIDLSVDGKTKAKAFIKNTQFDILKDRNLHVDFHVIDEDKPIKVEVKIQLAGNPAGVRDGGVLNTSVKTVAIQCMPKDLPARIVADISGLALNQSMHIKDLPLQKDVKILSNPDGVIAHIRNPK